MTVGHHLPSTIPRFDETIFSGGDGGIAENLGMMGRINSGQAARSHGPTPFVAAVGAVLIPDCRSGAENAQGGGDCKRDESLLSTHGSSLHLLRLSGRDRDPVDEHGVNLISESIHDRMYDLIDGASFFAGQDF
jgi:hypothetical protein